MPPADKRSKSEIWRTRSGAKAVEAELRRLGNRLYEIREARGWTLEETAEKAKLHAVTLSRIENGRTNVTVASLVALARAYDVPMSDLFPPP